MAQLNFNAQQHEPQQAFTPLPEGWYPVMITNSEMKPVKPPKQGAYLNLELTVQGGEHNNRKVFARLNLQNENPVAEEIAQRELSSICHVTGVMQVQDSQQLHGIPFQVKLVVKPAEGNYSASNEIKGYRDINGNDPGKQNGGGQAPGQVRQGGPQAPQAPGQPQMPPPQQQQPQQGGWQQPPQQAPQQQAPAPQGGQPWQQPQQQQAPQQPQQQAPQQGGDWQQGGQPVQPQGQPPQQDPNQGQAPSPQPPQDQGYTQPPQGGQAQPVAPPPAGDQSGVPPWQRQQQGG